MHLTTGQTVYLAFATAADSRGQPVAWVTQATVIDAENRILRRDNGVVTVFDEYYRVETIHDSSAAAWDAAATILEADADAIAAKAAECRAKAAAAASQIVAVPA